MARFVGTVQFVGRAGEITAYTRTGSDKIIVRKREGVSGKKVKKSPTFALTRRYNAEFGGRSAASRFILDGLHSLKPLADYNIAGPINSLLRYAQKTDTVNELGERSILISRVPGLLNGFSFNKKFNFESIHRNPLDFTISKEDLTATISLPAIIPGINLVAPTQYAMYRIVATLSIVPDIAYNSKFRKHRPINGKDQIGIDKTQTQWLSLRQSSEPVTMNLKIKKNNHADQPFSLMLGIGIAFGVMQTDTIVEQAKHAGAAKILSIV